MQTILLPGGTTPTTRIGLGCGRLAGGAGFRNSAAVIEAALDAGVRHFDVAPSYGLGLAEGVLGQAIGSHRETTITTKAGISAPKGGRVLSVIRQAAKPLAARLPSVKAHLAMAVSAVAAPARGLFTPDQVQASFEASLKALRRDRVDVFLLHEPGRETPAEIEPLLEDLQAQGRIGAFGAGTGGDAGSLPFLGQVAQHAWTPGIGTTRGRMAIRHGLLRRWVPRLRSALPMDAAERLTLSDQLDCDLGDPNALPSLLLTMVLSAKPGGIVLVSSTEPARLTRVIQGVDWSAVRGERAAFVAARDRLIGTLSMEAADVQP